MRADDAAQSATLAKPATEEQREQCFDLWRLAFAVDQPWMETFKSRAGWGTTRVLEVNGAIAATAVVHPFGQFFGGRRLDCAGVALVSCDPQHRSRGLTRSLVQAVLREQHAEGVPISALYPSTRTLYRKVGYETAGSIFEYTIPMHRIDVGRADGCVRRLEERDTGLVRELYAAKAAQSPGWLDRNDFAWHRVFYQRTGEKRDGYLIEIDGCAEGYFFYHRDREKRSLETADLVILSAKAGRRFLSFMADQRSVIDNLVFWGGPNDPVLMLLNEQRFETKNDVSWMLRIIDAEEALGQRGYSAAVAAKILFEVHGDDVISENNDRFLLTVSGGSARVERGDGDHRVPTVRASIRGLAPLFSGHLSARELRDAGLIDGDSPSLEIATTIFAGPQPWMADGF